MHYLRLAPLCVLFASLPAFAADLLVVDANFTPGANFGSIAAAVAAAQPGDILLVRSGTYGGFTVASKPLSILADEGAFAEITSSVEVHSIATGTAFTLRGFRFQADADLLVAQCSGAVRLEDLDLTESIEQGSDLVTSNITVEDSLRVRLARVRLGHDGVNPVSTPTMGVVAADAPQAALTLISSDVNVLHSELYGTPGRDSFVNPGSMLWLIGTEGGHAVQLTSVSSLRLASSSVTGGAGGDGVSSTAFGCVAPQDGGDAIRVEAGFIHSLSLHDTALSGGSAGAKAEDIPSLFSCPSSAADGSAVSQAVGAFLGAVESGRLLPDLELTAALREGQASTATYHGQAGDLAYLISGPSAVATPIEFFTQYLWLESQFPALLIPMGIADGQGEATLAIPAIGDSLVPGIGLVFCSQVLGIDTSGNVELGSFATTTLVDAAQ